VQYHLVFALLRRGDDRLKAGFDDAVERIKRIHGFRGIANDNEDFGLGHKSGGSLSWRGAFGRTGTEQTRRNAAEPTRF
jgi:hypothetical protein